MASAQAESRRLALHGFAQGCVSRIIANEKALLSERVHSIRLSTWVRCLDMGQQLLVDAVARCRQSQQLCDMAYSAFDDLHESVSFLVPLVSRLIGALKENWPCAASNVAEALCFRIGFGVPGVLGCVHIEWQRGHCIISCK